MYLIDLGLAPSVDQALSTIMDASQKAVELDPDDGKTHLALGGAYAYYGKPEQALAEFDRAEALSPSDADLLLVIAWTIPGFGKSERAVELAERSLKLNPHYPDWYNQGLSLVFFFGEQFDKSVKYRLLVKEPLASTTPSWPWPMRISAARARQIGLPPTSRRSILPGTRNDISARRVGTRKGRPSCL
jgi:tetratricopeptide (TPR) repeat protein